jgi:hypothetical protein
MIVYMNLSMICKYMENDLYSISSKKKKKTLYLVVRKKLRGILYAMKQTT